jgi:RND family efflux transporter MFP subunit
MTMNTRTILTTLGRHWGKLLALTLLALSIAAAPFVFAPDHGNAVATMYHCPMHPTYTSDRPGDCPICGMRLVPTVVSPAGGDGPTPAETKATTDVKPDAAGGTGIEGLAPVHASETQSSLAGIRTAVATSGVLVSTVRAVGNVVADETRIRQVNTKVAGWVETLHVNAVGQFVTAGQPLFDLYSPELLASQEEYLRARQTAAQFQSSTLPEVRRGGQDLATAARRRLQLLDVPQEFLERIETTGAAQRTITFRAPFNGYVTEKMVLEGQRIDPGMPLLTVSDLSHVWVVAQLYETEAASAIPGQHAVLFLQYDDSVRLSGRVSLVYPTVDIESRTIKVRFEFANPRLTLKPGMFVNVEIDGQRSRGVMIPDSALIDTGTRQVVFVEVSPGHFEPREVKAGARRDGQVLIRTGVKAGEQVAISANFLLDSESRLRAAIGATAKPGHEQHK